MAILRLSALSPCLFLYFVCSPLYLPSGAFFAAYVFRFSPYFITRGVRRVPLYLLFLLAWVLVFARVLKSGPRFSSWGVLALTQLLRVSWLSRLLPRISLSSTRGRGTGRRVVRVFSFSYSSFRSLFTCGPCYLSSRFLFYYLACF